MLQKRMAALLMACALLCPVFALGENAMANQTEMMMGFVYKDFGEVIPEEGTIFVAGPRDNYKLAIPEDGPEAPEYRGKAVRFTLSKGDLALGETGDFDYSVRVLEPLTLEIAGDALIGEIISCDAEKVVIKGWEEGRMDEYTFIITEETVAHSAGGSEYPERRLLGDGYLEIYSAGRACHVFYNPETMEALWLEESYG